jgi:hypothetical protein
MAMSFTDGATADDSMRAALAATAGDVSSSSDEETPSEGGVPVEAPAPSTANGFTWPEHDPTRVEIETLAGSIFRFLPVKGL